MAWDETSEAHLARHTLTPDEVEDVLFCRPRLVQAGPHDTAYVMGTTLAGRCLTGVAAEPMVVTSIRLPRPLMQRVRAQADAAGVPATALIRGWVEDRLVAQETGDISRDQLVAALRSVLADLDPLRAHLAGSA